MQVHDRRDIDVPVIQEQEHECLCNMNSSINSQLTLATFRNTMQSVRCIPYYTMLTHKYVEQSMRIVLMAQYRDTMEQLSTEEKHFVAT